MVDGRVGGAAETLKAWRARCFEGLTAPAYLLTDAAIITAHRRCPAIYEAGTPEGHARRAELSIESHLRAAERKAEMEKADRAERFACIGNGLFVRTAAQ